MRCDRFVFVSQYQGVSKNKDEQGTPKVMNSDQMTTEKRQMPGMAYRYSLAFLDSHPKPESDQHIRRLVRLMAYDMVLVAGSRGEDVAGVFAACLRGLHATQGQLALDWKWEYEGMVFSAKPVSCPLEPNVSLSEATQSRVSSLCSSHWLNKIQDLPVPNPSGQLDNPKPTIYPDPQYTIEAACLLAIEAATMLSRVQQATICWHPHEGVGVEVGVDASDFVHKQTRRHFVNHALGE
jgi:hypothetical protein